MSKLNDIITIKIPLDDYYNYFKHKRDNTPFDRLPKFNPKLKCNIREMVYGVYYNRREEAHEKPYR